MKALHFGVFFSVSQMRNKYFDNVRGALVNEIFDYRKKNECARHLIRCAIPIINAV